MIEEFEQYLAHYGVKGQKWGNRQWQNEDGSYTEAGKERYWGGGGIRQRVQQQVTSYTQKMKQREQQQSIKRETPRQIEMKKEAQRRKRNKILAIAGGVALAAITGYALTRKRNMTPDQITKHINDYNRQVLKDRDRSLRIQRFWDNVHIKFRKRS